MTMRTLLVVVLSVAAVPCFAAMSQQEIAKLPPDKVRAIPTLRAGLAQKLFVARALRGWPISRAASPDRTQPVKLVLMPPLNQSLWTLLIASPTAAAAWVVLHLSARIERERRARRTRQRRGF
jgi:hypothetical protein